MTIKTNTGRYSVGEKLLVVSFQHMHPGRASSPALKKWTYDYWPKYMSVIHGVRVTGVELFELEVKEHHKVKWEYDEDGAEPRYDGYVLEDSKGNRWFNQYPTAAYGQVSDRANRLFDLDTDYSVASRGILHSATLFDTIVAEYFELINTLDYPDKRYYEDIWAMVMKKFEKYGDKYEIANREIFEDFFRIGVVPKATS